MVKPYEETHQQGDISIENVPECLHKYFVLGRFDCFSVEGDLGIQIAEDGRVWVCIDGVAFIRFKPKVPPPQCSRRLHHRGGIYHCLRVADHEPDGHLFELADVDTRVEKDDEETT